MTEENTVVETVETVTPTEVKEINNEVLNMEPSEIDEDFIFNEWEPLDMKTVFIDSEEAEVFGNWKQKIEIYTDLANYMGDVENPATTAANSYFKKADGSSSLYAPLDEVLNSVRKVLSKYGFGILQFPTIEIGRVSVKTILTHKSGGSINSPKVTLPIAKNDAQGIIAAITYARRAALNTILAIHGEVDDDGNEAAGAKPQVKENAKPNLPPEVTDKQKEIVSLAKELIDGKVDREVVNKALLDTCKSKNPNSVKDVKLLEAAYSVLDEIRNNMKKEGK